MAKTKTKRKHKKSKSEKLFIKEQGIELYDKLLEENPGIETDPEMFEFLNKIAKFYKPPVAPSLRSLHDKYFNYPRANGGGSDD